MEILAQAAGTVMLRPYVFAFLAAYLLGCGLSMGISRAALFCVAGYLIAWVSELSSIHNGVPYGHYHYIEATRGAELWVVGVPLMDSLSYVFLAYASYSVALLVSSPLCRWGRLIYVLETKRTRHSLYTRALGALFFVYLDIIIDPVALKGQKWFLGAIYGYESEGAYFGVPLTNFIGWLVVGFIMVYALQTIDRRMKGPASGAGARYPWRHLIGPLLYVSVLVFNLTVTFSINEPGMGLAGVFIVLLPCVLVFAIAREKLLNTGRAAVYAHCKDFPDAVLPGTAMIEAPRGKPRGIFDM